MNVILNLKKTDQCWNSGINKLSKKCNLKIEYGNEYSLEDCDVLIATRVSEKVIKTANCLKVIFAPKTGIDSFPIESVINKKISVCNSHANSNIIAEHAISLGMALTNRIVEFDSDMRKGIWYSNGIDYYWKSIFNMNIGILGFGHVGNCIKDFFEKFDCSIYTLNRKSMVMSEKIFLTDSLEELCDKSDILFVTLPDTEKTKNMLNDSILQHLKNKFIINVGRASVLCEMELYNRLIDGTLAGVALDVWNISPNKVLKNKIMPSKYNFENLNNVILSPHSSTHEIHAHQNYVDDIINKVEIYLTKGILTDEVNILKRY